MEKTVGMHSADKKIVFFFFFVNLRFVQIDKSDAMRSVVDANCVCFLSHLLLCVYVLRFDFCGLVGQLQGRIFYWIVFC